MSDTDQLRAEFEVAFKRDCLQGMSDPAEWDKVTTQCMQFAKTFYEQGYKAGRAAAEKSGKRWDEFSAAVNHALASDKGFADLWGKEQRLYASVYWHHRGECYIDVRFNYPATEETRENLGAALDLIEGADKTGSAQSEESHHAVPSKEPNSPDDLPRTLGWSDKLAKD